MYEKNGKRPSLPAFRPSVRAVGTHRHVRTASDAVPAVRTAQIGDCFRHSARNSTFFFRRA